MAKYDLGIIGGMGSEATVEIFKRIVNKTEISCDQDHIKICILNNSIIPDRTDYILNNGENPLPYLQQSIKDLEELDVKYFVIPCNTAHYFENEFKKSKCNFISMVEETWKYVNEHYDDNIKVCILGTTGTINTRVYHNHILANKINFVFTSNEEQQQIMTIINETKSNVDRNYTTNKLINIVKGINEREKNCIFIVACTELSLYYEILKKEFLIIDSMNCLIDTAINTCGYKLKK